MPWCQNNPVLVLHPSGFRYSFVDNRESKRRELGHFPVGIQWAAVGKLLAITCDGRVQILDTGAEDLASISVHHPKFEYPAVFWWRDGRRIAGPPSGPKHDSLLLIQPAADSLALPVSIPQSFSPMIKPPTRELGRHRIH